MDNKSKKQDYKDGSGLRFINFDFVTRILCFLTIILSH